MDTSYAKFGIQTAQQFDTALNDEDEGFGPPSIHINDIGHNIKNAEASSERGMHWNGSVSYDANDLAIMLASPPSDDVYSKLYRGVSHPTICQFDSHSDEFGSPENIKACYRKL